MIESPNTAELISCTPQKMLGYGVQCALAAVVADRAKRVPLTHEQAAQIVHSVMTSPNPDGVAIALARAFEKHYGIGVAP